MDSLKNKSYKDYDYVSRYSSFPFYYDTIDNKYVSGITGQLNLDCTYLIHTVIDTDSFDSIALKYYGRPDLYWVICDFNRIQDSFIKPYGVYKTLMIPTLSEVRFIK